MSAQTAPVFEPIRGGYVHVNVEGIDYRIFYEEAGSGPPLLCLHTAGADSRQWRHLFNDKAVTDRFRVVAFDLPYHGRSNPPANWWLRKWELTVKVYVGVIRAVWKALGLEKPVVLGCSIGGFVVLQLAVDFPSELRGVIGLQSVANGIGRHNEFLHHPAIHGGEFAACYTYGLNSPLSPEEARRENWWYYAQGGPGVYAGDTAFGREFDVRAQLKDIDTRVCKVSILSGDYDYSALPSVTQTVAEAIPGARFSLIPGLGHFPVIEDYPKLRPYLATELNHMLGQPVVEAGAVS
jgi:pimeloyl-ACP methyl ester carboxylesterase